MVGDPAAVGREARLVDSGAANGQTSEEFVEQFIGKFYADYFTWVSIATSFIQIFLVARIMTRFGVRAALYVLPVVALGLLGGFLVYRWARDLHGPGAGLAALALYVFCPTLVAHSHLATVDVGAATLTVATLYTFDRWLRRPGPGALALCGLVLGLAQLAKFTALLLYPMLVLLALLAPRREDAPRPEHGVEPAGRPEAR